MQNINPEHLKTLLDKQRRFKIILGSIFGLLLVIYFFSFATLIDKAPPGFFYFELVTGIAMAVMLFMLNKISFGYVSRRFGGKTEYKPWIGKLRRDDVDQKFEKVLKELEQR